jgi:hypothetical protein
VEVFLRGLSEYKTQNTVEAYAILKRALKAKAKKEKKEEEHCLVLSMLLECRDKASNTLTVIFFAYLSDFLSQVHLTPPHWPGLSSQAETAANPRGSA